LEGAKCKGSWGLKGRLPFRSRKPSEKEEGLREAMETPSICVWERERGEREKGGVSVTGRREC